MISTAGQLPPSEIQLAAAEMVVSIMSSTAFAVAVILSPGFNTAFLTTSRPASCITGCRTSNRVAVDDVSLLKRNYVGIYGSLTSSSSRSFTLSVGNWWEDDLPNILGINPFEAALIFGALYKFYGPGVLYEFAREAGKLFSTYAPIVRDLSLDIFNEGKNYLEEDRDRELLRKSGVDVDNMPRKTTNIIERFQAGMEVHKNIGKIPSLLEDTKTICLLK